MVLVLVVLRPCAYVVEFEDVMLVVFPSLGGFGVAYETDEAFNQPFFIPGLNSVPLF